jgi:hypothetical protein
MDPEKNRQIDEWLEAALKQYGKVEPRAGLENRVLASVRAERERARTPRWQWWPVFVVVTAIVVMGVGIFLVRAKTAAPLTKQNVMEPVGQPAKLTTETSNVGVQQVTHKRPTVSRTARRREIASAAKAGTNQFPSPQPLSDQEIMLARYIEQFPREATLMARAQTELMQQEMLAGQKPESPSSDSEVQNQ